MATILLSIKPKYVQEILSEKKKYEYRKRVANQKVDSIIIYSTAPQKRVVAKVEVEMVISDTPQNLWRATSTKSGIDEESFFDYFSESEIAHAYVLGNLNIFDEALTLEAIGVETAPQSFCYVSNGEVADN